MSSIVHFDNKIYIDGKEVEQPKSLFFNNVICQINNKIYINGKEKINGKWRYTIKSLYHTIF